MFLSPRGGLYASALVGAAPEHRPGPITAAMAVAAASAAERISGVACGIKWPNDVWIGRRKVGGLLLEASGGDAPVVVGLGLNLDRVPQGLSSDDTTCLSAEAGRAVSRDAVLRAWLEAVDEASAALRTAPGDLEASWRRRLLFVGETIELSSGGRRLRGRLLEADLARGLRLAEDGGGPAAWHRAEHVTEVRPSGDGRPAC